MTTKRKLHIGLCGAGLDGLEAAMAIPRAGCEIAVLEAAAELGEIGAGIQMTPNVSRLLIKCGVADIIVDHLMQCKEIVLRRTDAKVVQRTELVPKTVREFGFPVCVQLHYRRVHRHHLHFGLAEAARRLGVEIVSNARVVEIRLQRFPVRVRTESDQLYDSDLLIGSDGVKFVVRQTLFPDVKPRAPTNEAAYRAVMPYSEVHSRVPETRDFDNAIDIWMLDKWCVIMYPIATGRDRNAVLSHYRDGPVTQVEDEDDVDVDEVRPYYAKVDPHLKKIIDIVPSMKRCPLLVTGPFTLSVEPAE